MPSFNRVILMGNLTRDPELRYIPSGMAVSDVRLAVTDKRKNAKGDWAEETLFIDVTLWGRTAEVVNEYLSKGSPIFIEGRLKLDEWEANGEKKSKIRVVAERMQMVGGRGDGQGGRGGGRPTQSYDESEAGRSGGGFDGGFDGGDYSEPAPRGAPAGGPPADDIPF